MPVAPALLNRCTAPTVPTCSGTRERCEIFIGPLVPPPPTHAQGMGLVSAGPGPRTVLSGGLAPGSARPSRWSGAISRDARAFAAAAPRVGAAAAAAAAAEGGMGVGGQPGRASPPTPDRMPDGDPQSADGHPMMKLSKPASPPRRTAARRHHHEW